MQYGRQNGHGLRIWRNSLYSMWNGLPRTGARRKKRAE